MIDFNFDQFAQFQVPSTADSMPQEDVKKECGKNYSDYILLGVQYSAAKYRSVVHEIKKM